MRALALLALVAASCGTPPEPTIAAPVAPAPAPATGRYLSCASACAQHCGTVPSTERAECELGQVQCGCAPGMRRPPAVLPSTPAATPTPTPASTPTPSSAEPATDLATSVPGCFGPSVALTTWEATPYAEVQIGEARGAFLIDFGTTFSTLDPSAFTPLPDGSLGCYAVDFFGPWPCLSLRSSDHRGVGTPFPQAGILGTDVLSQHIYVIDYEHAHLHRSDSSSFCSPEALRAAGLAPLTTSDWGPSRDRSRVHVPAVLVRIGAASAPAQLDTGFADRRVRHAINVNQAFFDAIVASGTVLTRAPEHDLTLSTCVAGVRESVTAYRIPDGLVFVSLDGRHARTEEATLFLKATPSEARRCGGIGTWTDPGAQLGASFLGDAGLVVFHPTRGEVWIPAE